MNSELLSYLKVAKPKEDHEILNGIKQTESDYELLKDEVKQIIPNWVKHMLIDFKIANLILDFKFQEDEQISIQFNSFKQIEDACLNMYPGCAIFELGYIGIGEDPTGSGNPYFIKIDEGENPPLYQIYHDVSDKGEEIVKQGKELISNKLSDIFKNQIK
ncbi:hypothetical protein [Flammeovirga pacifica]|uniref:Knr4/Smi1-like domain-containing protein n=1 Tax=Flammeovirga pacifica TaxID=915059 RepID=A0A1S1YRS4_FLAPC|nr:hypothetical protein [Flammeovirga pacifica]OHX63786.1 hypothetical protein NH26_24900 [Flammeovirga pacifica]